MKINQSEFLKAIGAAAATRCAKPATSPRTANVLALLERLGLTPTEVKRSLSPRPECRGCGVALVPENDSAAHAIPNALGGRLKPRGILCRSCNGELDDLADNALVKAFGAWPTLLNLPRDRGTPPVVKMERRDGRRARVRPDGGISLADPVYEVREVPDGHALRIAAGDMTVVSNLLRRAAKQFPQIDLAEAAKYAALAKEASDRRVREGVIGDDDHVRATFHYHPRAVFGGVATAIWIFLIDRLGGAPMDWTGLKSFISKVQANGGPLRHFVDGLPGLIGPDIDLGHKIVVRSIPRTGELVAYVEILGALRVGGVIAKAPTPAKKIELVYAYDIEAGRDRSDEFSIDAETFEQADWKTVGLGPLDAEALREHFTGVFRHLEAVYHRRGAANVAPDPAD